MKKIVLLLLALILALSLAACAGNTDNDGNNSTNPPVSNNGGNNNGGSSLFDIPIDKIIGSSEAIAEIPAELFKGAGELSYCQVMTSGALEGYKYTLAINLSTEDDKADAELEKLIDYYRSIGAAVEKTNELLNDYNVNFDFAESVSITALSSSIQIQLSVVKE